MENNTLANDHRFQVRCRCARCLFVYNVQCALRADESNHSQKFYNLIKWLRCKVFRFVVQTTYPIVFTRTRKYKSVIEKATLRHYSKISIDVKHKFCKFLFCLLNKDTYVYWCKYADIRRVLMREKETLIKLHIYTKHWRNCWKLITG